MITTQIELPHIYEPRPYQMDFWDAFHGTGKHKGKHYNIFVLNWHRRGGKDMTCWNAAIERTAEEVMTCKYAFPTNDMARENLWESVTNDGLAFTDFVPLELRVRKKKNDDGLNDSLKRIEFVTGGSIRVLSAFKPDRLRGGNSKVFALSELQIMDPRVIDIIEPILEANGGVLIVNLTANGDSAAKQMMESWKNDPNVYVSILTVKDTGVFKPDQMQRIRRRTIERFEARGLSREEANAFVDQEYYCSWESPVIGSYFGSAMSMAQKTGRITSVPFDSLLSVNTYWDLGIDDSMSIWFVQLFANEVRHIDYYESSGEGIAHYIKVLRGQIEGFEHMSQYVYGKHYGPHDLAVRELGTGVSRLEKAKTLGINFEVVKRPTAKEDGIEAIRSIIPRSYYDKKRCARGISALKGYRKKWNDKLMVYENVPVHDWTSHATDAEQTLALTNPQAKRNHVRPQIKRSKFHV